jgi:hypothetical protein
LHSSDTGEKWEYNETVHQLFVDFKKAYDSRMGEKRNAYRILVGKPEGKRPLGRPRNRWVDNNKWILER